MTIAHAGWRICRSAIAVAALVLAAGCTRTDTLPPPWDLSEALVPATTIVAAGDTRTALAPIDQPTMITPAEVDLRNAEQRGKLLVADDRVVGVVVAEEARAYPLRLLRWHEVVNDVVAGTPIAVTYSPLSDSVVVFRREVAGQILRFAHSGFLCSSSSLLIDRPPDQSRSSLWSPLQARAVAGGAKGTALELLAAAVATWEQWRARHPDTVVLAPEASYARLYKRDPYHSYFGSDLLRFPVDPLPAPDLGLDLKDRIAAVSVDGETRVFALSRLADAIGSPSGTWRTEIAGVPIQLSFDHRTGTAIVDAPPGHRLAVRTSFWFAWYALSLDDDDRVPRPAG